MILLTKQQMIQAYRHLGVTLDNLPRKGQELRLIQPTASPYDSMIIVKRGTLYEAKIIA